MNAPRSLQVKETQDACDWTVRKYTRPTGEPVAIVTVIPSVSDYGHSKIVRLGDSTPQSLNGVLQAEGIVGLVRKVKGALYYHPFSSPIKGAYYDCPLPCDINRLPNGDIKATPRYEPVYQLMTTHPLPRY